MGYQRWVRLFGILKYALAFLALELYLPLTAIPSLPGADLLGGLFLGHDAGRIFWASAAFFGAAWSLMFCAGLLLDCHRGAATDLPSERSGMQAGAPNLPAMAAFLSLPVSAAQFWSFSALGAYGAAVMVATASGSRWAAGASAVAGGLAAHLALVVLLTPARLAVPEYRPVWESAAARAFWRLAGLVPGARALSRAFLALVSAVPRWLGMRYVLDGGKLRFPHFFAATSLLGIYLVLQLFGWVFYPPHPALGFGGPLAPFLPTAAAYLYVLIVLLTWTVLGADCHLSRLRLSPVVALLIVMVASYRLDRTDHYFRVLAGGEVPGADPLTALAARQNERALVIVTSSGGGILAAGWTTLALEKMIEREPSLARQIALLSTISGGSVGAAYYLAEQLDAPDPADPALLARAYRESVTSSLASAAYGFALIDFWRLFGGPLFHRDRDRGTLLEATWRRTFAEAAPGREGAIALDRLREPIESGELPAVIMSSTVMETGRRVMFTPLRMPGTGRELPATLVTRGMTLPEFLGPECLPESDLELWTAARMSASFAWVSPAARARGTSCGPGVSRQHLIDGGYFDNYGVASALDWLEPALECRWRAADNPTLGGEEGHCPHALDFGRVAIVRLNAFAWADPAAVPGDSGAISAALGPVLGLAAIRTGVAVSRNEIDLARLESRWNQRFAEAGMDVCIDDVELRPFLDSLPVEQREACSHAPLSWHLTEGQKACQLELWETGALSSHPGHIGSQLRELREHLSSRQCAR
jgi:hypothetical protein